MLTTSSCDSRAPRADIRIGGDCRANPARAATGTPFLACIAGLLAIGVALALRVPQAPPANSQPVVRPAIPATVTQVPDGPRQDAWIHLDVQPGDSLSTLFDRAGLPASQWLDVQALGEDAEPLLQARAGDVIDILAHADGQLQQVRKSLDTISTLVIARRNGQLQARIERRRTELRQRALEGRIAHSLSQAVRTAGGTPVLSLQLARIFGDRLDLRHRVRNGDHFTAIYESQLLDGEPVETGAVLAARLLLGGKSYEAFRYTDASGRTAYYDADGLPYERSILRAPLRYTRISSGFSLRRFDPVLHVWRAHDGVDYAAPTGTPIEAAADGRVAFAGRAHGYGRLIEVRHFDGYSTRYAHLSAFASGLHQGAAVVQGQIIGYVGASGEATGPHLHFEIRVRGAPRNPRTVALPGGHAIPRPELARYRSSIQPLLARLDLPAKTADTMLASDDAVPAGSEGADPGPTPWRSTPTHGTRGRRSPTAKAARAMAAHAQMSTIGPRRPDARTAAQLHG
nr:peptidoglycan DD-metalloendopeptidase family protein [Solimonas terrae]